MILVTGVGGFIGSHLVERLLADGYRVLGVDNFDLFYPRSVKESNMAGFRNDPRFLLAEVDIRDPGALRTVFTGATEPISGIVHLAAKAGVRPSLEDPRTYNEVNVMGTLNLLELARELGVTQFVAASSSSVYGVNPRVPWREDDHDLQPISPYASTKLSLEMLGHVYAHVYKVRMVALRFFTVYGPRQRPDLAIAKFARLIRAGKPVPFFGDGSTRRDYTFIADIVDGIVRSLAYTATPFEVINLGNRNTVTLAELVAAIGRTFGITPTLDHQPEQPGDVPQTWADVDKASQLLGWQPRTRLEDGLRSYRVWLDGLAAEPAT